MYFTLLCPTQQRSCIHSFLTRQPIPLAKANPNPNPTIFLSLVEFCALNETIEMCTKITKNKAAASLTILQRAQQVNKAVRYCMYVPNKELWQLATGTLRPPLVLWPNSPQTYSPLARNTQAQAL